MVVKTDMSKVYDRVEWRFILQVFQRLGFYEKWVKLIIECVTIIFYFYLINDLVQGSVIFNMGIRHVMSSSPWISTWN